ncbi:MAG: hypothetical protein ABI142_02515 [Bryocella sp.]
MRKPVSRFLLIASTVVALAYASQALAQSTSGADEHPDSRFDVYAGYGYFHPLKSGVDGKQYVDVYNPNVTVSVTGWFNHYFGAQIEGSYFSGNNEHRQYYPTSAVCNANCDQMIYTAQAGPVMRFPLGSWVPFIHALGGGARVNGPAQQNLKWGWGVTGGGGVDWVVPFFKRIAIRPIQADFQYSQVVYGPLVLPAGVTGGFGEIDALKLSAGLVLRFGEKSEKRPIVMECSTAPPVVHPGDLVTVTASTADLVDKKKTVYTWAASGGKVTPSGPEATIDTTGLAPGDYKATGHVQQGMKAVENAGCDAPFTVKDFDPPTISCSVNPSTAISGTSIVIAATGNSPQNRPLTYSYTSSAGQISAQANAATLATAGLSPQQITVTCNVVDDLGHKATSTAAVTIEQPPVPVVTQTQPLCGLSFDRDRKRPARVDNESKACLDDIALTMNQQADAKLVIVGNASPDEKPEVAAERTLNVRQYLTQEKGVDQARIEVRVGDTSGRTVNNTLLPPGAIFSDTNTELFDETKIPRNGQAYGVPRTRSTPPAARNTPPATKRAPHSRRRQRSQTMTGTATPPGSQVPDNQIGPFPPPGGSTLSQLPK